ncbi:two-component response regulator-like APRR5 isoform X1 [Syzygium oleosum]|uniref:two-component response regulator-like APRR5 isoform X1 n=1 Tax=Syzygium oleosum TaxID=219896 RepID=UPI0011D227CE|nr:two-component response regulator-like APRR5 isoform X1 [Syzygium oleosum]
MGEVVVSSSDGMEEREEEVVEVVGGAGGTAAEKQAGSPGGVVKWERFLPRMVLRVLLVEADDSTRQIIAALLRKCSYRVAAVPDGLKAWELLKGRPHSIDLILTEVELPSISGYALLTLIMEHDICKNIPVIMMSTQDAVSTVYKCMLRGAADYLVKPIRRNELKNLWQHVWRRQTSTASASGREDETNALQKVEATAENNATSCHSSGYMACVERDRELIEKGSDAQSSCTKPDLEAEITEIEQVPDFSRPGWDKSSVNDNKIAMPEEKVKSTQEELVLQEDSADAAMVDAHKCSHALTQIKDARSEVHRGDENAVSDGCGDNDGIMNSYRQAINLIGAFENNSHACYVDCPSNYGMRQPDFSPHLDLSLKRSDPSSFGNQKTEERQTLKHSDASAFSRYVNKSSQPLRPQSVNVPIQRMAHGNDPDKEALHVVDDSNPDTSVPVQSTPTSMIASGSTQSRQSEYILSCPQQSGFPAPIPVRGVRFDNLSTDYGSVFPRIYCGQSVPSPVPSPSTTGQQDAFFRSESLHQSSCENNNCDRIQNPLDQNTSNSSNQSRYKQEFKFDSLEDRGHISPGTDRSATSSFCNGTLTGLSSLDCGSNSGSNGNVNQVSATRHAGESIGGDGIVAQDGSSRRATQREAALAKFRLKRKDRCYEKKVRYESRKKLAEQRPRVKGQFVRQVPADPAPGETNP